MAIYCQHSQAEIRCQWIGAAVTGLQFAHRLTTAFGEMAFEDGVKSLIAQLGAKASS